MPSQPDPLHAPASPRTRRLLHASLALSLVAAAITVTTGYPLAAWLVWNLFLAWVPYVFGRGIVRLARATPHGTGVLVAPTALWLLFFPNAPYIVTDLIHVANLPVAFMAPGALLIAGFAAVAMALGLFTLRDVHRIVERRLGTRWGWGFVVTVVFLGAIGVWTGRFLRWNSWDAFTRPWTVLRSTVDGIAGSPVAVAYVLALTALVMLLYRVTVHRADA
jgi:uncharacterized membrane protein